MEAELSPALQAVVLSVMAAGLGVWSIVIRRWTSGTPALAWRRRRRVPWGIEGALLPLLLVLVSLLSVGATEEAAPPAEPLGLADAAQVTLVYGGMMALAVAVIQARSEPRPRCFGLASGGGRDPGIGLLACLAALPLVYLVQALVVHWVGLPASHPILESLSQSDWSQKAAAAWLAVIVAPVMEEFAFRSLLQGWLERLAPRGAWWPVVASSLTFAAAHQGQGYAPIALTVFGLVIGYLYRQTHSLMACVAMHAAFNGLSFGLALWQYG